MSIEVTECFDEADCDTIGADTSDASVSVLSHIQRVVNGLASGVELSSISRSAVRLEDDHKLVIPDFQLKYSYELEPRVIDGERWFEYGIDATKNKVPYVGYILHHTSDTAFENILRYTQRYDPKRRGTFGYHFLIGRDGRSVQAAPLSKRTNHFSDSEKRYAQKHLVKANTASLSLHGGYRKENGRYVYIPPTIEQLRSAKIIMSALEQIYGASLKNTWGHGEVQSNRMDEEGLVLAQWCRSNGV